MKTSEQLRKDFIDFWTKAPRNFKEVPNMSLVPNVHSTLLFVNSGMFPLAPYLGGQPHPLGKRLVDIQRCLRTNYDEMIEIGDNRHTLMFEMIGDWSLGDFTKEDQIPWILEFWVEVCGMDPKRLYVSVFAGDDDAPRDTVAIEIWQKAFAKYGVEAKFSEDIHNIPSTLEESINWPYRIFPYPKKKNWWERAHASGELGGPTSEMFYDMGEIEKEQDKYHINDDSGRFMEIGNNVFMEYRLSSDMKWVPLEQKNIDFGGGFERVTMIMQGKEDIFETDIYEPIIKRTEEISGKEYKTNNKANEFTKYFRILADHSRAATFILADGIIPSNKDQGYILRRFIRRLVRFGLKLGITQDFTKDLALAVIEKMSYAYPHLKENQNMIIDEIDKEEIKFRRTLEQGLRHLQKIIQDQDLRTNPLQFSGKQAFDLYETYGFPVEMTLDELNLSEDDANALMDEFKKEELAHRESSRAGAEQKFKGGLADHSEETTKLHTAHHLLLAAMQKLIDPNIKQKGSNITAERLRIDFNFDRKLTTEEVQQVEELVNQKIHESLEVDAWRIKRERAENIGAQMEFGQKYSDFVTVYIIGNKSKILPPNKEDQDSKGSDTIAILLNEESKQELSKGILNYNGSNAYKLRRLGNYISEAFSIEFCGGPHVSNTSELAEGGKKFKIIEQENVGAGIKRIKAKLI